LNPRLHKIITIQYQCLHEPSLEPLGELTILKEWESSEKDILREFLEVFIGEDPFDFIPVGVNLAFDFRFLYHRVKYLMPDYVEKNKLTLEYLVWQKPYIDLKPILVMVNDFRFEGYDRLVEEHMKLETREKLVLTGSAIPYLYVSGKYKEIEEYVRSEAEATMEILRRIYKILKENSPRLRP